jgi:hypothetical protein
LDKAKFFNAFIVSEESLWLIVELRFDAFDKDTLGINKEKIKMEPTKNGWYLLNIYNNFS